MGTSPNNNLNVVQILKIMSQKEEINEQDNLYRELTKDLPSRKVITFNTIDIFIFDEKKLNKLKQQDNGEKVN